jgi:hypothetical protein
MAANNRSFTAASAFAATLALGSPALSMPSYVDGGTMQPEHIPSNLTPTFSRIGGATFNSISGGASWTLTQELQQMFEIISVEKVFAFVNQSLAQILLNTAAVIKEHFECQKLTLDVRTDYEDGSQILLLFIHSKTGWEDSQNRLDEFDRWWLCQKWLPSSKRICVDIYPA